MVSSILLVSPTGPAPDFLSLLNHDLSTAASAEEALRSMDVADVVVIDARGDLAWARTATTIVRQTHPDMPVLLLATTAALGLLSHDWGFSDIAIDYRPTLSGEARRAVIESGYRNYYSTLTNTNTGQLLYPTPDLVEEQVRLATENATKVPWTGHYTDWRKLLLRRGGAQNYEFSAMGGGEQTHGGGEPNPI